MQRIGPYRILRKLGEGGMGVVYAAEDERLRREVAIKTIRDRGDSSARERFAREARAAASVSHPNVCQLFDIGDEDGAPFLVMELLEGQSLDQRLRGQGALPLPDALQTALAILTALDALHARGFIHRDLKPSNVFLTAHGVKLLDFGLSREFAPATVGQDATTMAGPLTLTGMIVGTPRYMAPEQLNSGPADARTDLFAAGSILYEMIAGKSPFDGENAMQLYHAIVFENPPNLAGSAAIAAVNRVIHRALAKKPEDRYPNAAAMAKDVRELMLISDVGAAVVARRVTRLIALPFRILRGDADTDFLAFALPEAITTTLAAVGSLVVRSSAAAARFAASELDLKKLAEEADVDVALTGTLLRAGDQIRVTTQLIEVPAGTVIWSQSSQATMADVFELQDRLTQRIVESLELPLSEREARLVRRDVPATPRAHEFYLRAGQQGESPQAWAIARDLYLRALDEDPRYAPAWAALARIYLLLGKYSGTSGQEQYRLAESAARRALDLNPELPVAHRAYAHIEVSTGRALESTLRLLDRVARGTNDPAVFAALVTTCRFCGLLEQSAAADEQARALDPTISTSASHTYWMLGRYDDALRRVDPDRDFGDEAFIHAERGDIDKARAVFEDRKRRLIAAGGSLDSFSARVFDLFESVIVGTADVALPILDAMGLFPDPEGLFYMARGLAHIGERERALLMFADAVQGGFFCYPFFARDPWLDPLRGEARFTEAMRRAESRWREALRAVDAHPGSRVLAVG